MLWCIIILFPFPFFFTVFSLFLFFYSSWRCILVFYFIFLRLFRRFSFILFHLHFSRSSLLHCLHFLIFFLFFCYLLFPSLKFLLFLSSSSLFYNLSFSYLIYKDFNLINKINKYKLIDNDIITKTVINTVTIAHKNETTIFT